MSRKIVATYGMIKNYKNETSNKWLALSEFIDNSISSWEGNNKDNAIGLEITIEFDGTNKDNRKLTIKDNANAMDKNTLESAMQPSDIKGKSDKKYNQYGVGMKLGIFWYGEDGKVYSKEKKSHEYFVELKTSCNDLSREVMVDAKKSYDNAVEYDSGTTIVIEKIYDNKWLRTEDLIEIKNALGWRYRNLLEDKKNNKPGMKISLLHKVEDNRTKYGNIHYFVEPFFIKPFTLENFKIYHKNKKNYNYEAFENRYLKDIENLIDENKSNSVLIEFCEKLVKNEPLISIKEIPWENFDKPAILKFGIIDSTSENQQGKLGKINGVTTFHLDRAINHGPNTNASNSCIPFNKKAGVSFSSGDPTWRRLYGEINLTGYEVPDQNKSSFIWSYTGEENLSNNLQNIWNSLKELLSLIVKWEDNLKITNPVSTDKDKQKLVDFSKDSLDLSKITPKTEICDLTEKLEPCFYIEEEDKNIWILESVKDELISINQGDDLKNTYVSFNPNHKFWKPFIDNKETLEYRGNSIYPLVLLVALCGIYLEDKVFFKNGFLPYEEKYLKKFQDVVNLVVKTIESKNEK